MYLNKLRGEDKMKDSINILREKPEYEDYSENIVILTESEERAFGIISNKRKKCCKTTGGSGCSGCNSKKTSQSGCSGGCCKK